MSSVEQCPLPQRALLARYRDTGAFTDCYSLTLTRDVSQAEYVEAFYTTWVFKLERAILRWLVAKPSTDPLAKLLAMGRIDAFAAWTVEDRTQDQLLMCDYQRRTRSWFMTERSSQDGKATTRLYFGSAVVPASLESGNRSLGFPYDALLGFHKIYSRILLRAAASRLSKTTRQSLFSYGSLQSEQVQIATFGRALDGKVDQLAEFELVAPVPGVPQPANVVRSAVAGSSVPGMVFDVTESELAAADEYERRDGYLRIAARLASGSETWVYVDARSVQSHSEQERGDAGTQSLRGA